MPYGNIDENSDVADALFMVIAGHGNVKSMVKHLEQKQNTISMKLSFLRKKRLVSKNKWEYVPNWKEIIKLFRRLLTESANENTGWREGFLNVKRKDLKELEKYFPDDFTMKFLESYSLQYLYLELSFGMKAPSLKRLSEETLLHLWFLKPSELKKVNPKFFEMKKEMVEFSNDIQDAFQCMTNKDMRDNFKKELSDMITKGEKNGRK